MECEAVPELWPVDEPPPAHLIEARKSGDVVIANPADIEQRASRTGHRDAPPNASVDQVPIE